MSNILTVAYTTEGSTDQRFLHNIIRKTFEELAFDCQGLIEVYEPVFIPKVACGNFVEEVKGATKQAYKLGMHILCIHVDADDANDDNVSLNKINPSIDAVIELQAEDVCKNLVAIVPVQMSEAWMLADKELLKNEMETDMSLPDLQLTRQPESYADPKNAIENALTIAQKDFPKRRRKTTISELYQPIGQKIPIEKLEQLPSYKKFKSAAAEALQRLNYTL